MEQSYRKLLTESQQKERTALSKKWQKVNHPKKGQCCTVGPIKDLNDIKKLKEYLRQKSARDYCLWVLASNNGLRMIDILRLKVKDLIDLEPGETIKVKETKTKKTNIVCLNSTAYEALHNYLKKGKHTEPNDWLFPSQMHPKNSIDTTGVNLMIKSWCKKLKIKGNFGSHTCRKTWGYHQRVTHKTDITIIMKRFSHSSLDQTLRYIGLSEEEVNGALLNEI
ncbi:MAG: tyrosine-type recombinase/integrase [Pseudomonadota bacterium]